MSDGYTVVVEEGFAGEEFEQIMAPPDALVPQVAAVAANCRRYVVSRSPAHRTAPRASQDGRLYDRVPATNRRESDAQVCLGVIGGRNGLGRDCASRLRDCSRASAGDGQ